MLLSTIRKYQLRYGDDASSNDDNVVEGKKNLLPVLIAGDFNSTPSSGM